MLYVNICGSDAVGKSTVISLLNNLLTNDGYDILFTKEPVNSGLLLDSSGNDMPIRTIAKQLISIDDTACLLMNNVCRRLHLLEINKWVKDHPNGIILQDRGLACTKAYQIRENGNVTLEDVEKLHDIICQDELEYLKYPGLTFILELDEKIARERMKLSNEHTADLDIALEERIRIRDNYRMQNNGNTNVKFIENIDSKNTTNLIYGYIKGKINE